MIVVTNSGTLLAFYSTFLLLDAHSRPSYWPSLLAWDFWCDSWVWWGTMWGLGMESLSLLVHKNSILYYLCLQVAKGHLFLIYRQHCEPFLLVFIFISIYCAAFEKRRTVFGNLLFYRMMKQTLFLPVQLIYREKNKFSFRNICIYRTDKSANHIHRICFMNMFWRLLWNKMRKQPI